MIGYLKKSSVNAVAAGLVNNNVTLNASIGNSSQNNKQHTAGSSCDENDLNSLGNQDMSNKTCQPVLLKDDSGSQNSFKQPVVIPALNFGGIIQSQAHHPLTARHLATKSRNGGMGTKQSTFDELTIKNEFNMPSTSRNSVFKSSRQSIDNEGGSTDLIGGGLNSFKAGAGRKQGNFKQRMSILNNDGLSQREKQDLRDQFKMVKEVFDPSKNGAIFDIKNSQQYNGQQSLSTTDYIPKKPVMEHLKKVEMRHNEKVQLYKQYTLDLKEKYMKFEVESQRHYANIIKKHQKQTDDIIDNKESLLEQMKHSKEQSLDELNLLRAKLYKARAEGKIDVLNEDEGLNEKEQQEKKLVAAEQTEDLDLDRPVDPQAFEALKVYRNKLKDQNIEWIAKFKRAHSRDPTDTDLDAIKNQIEDYNNSNNKYILMKAKMIRQGVIPVNLVKKAQKVEQPQQAPSAAVQRQMSMTGFKFNKSQKLDEAAHLSSTKGFHDAFLGDPSLRKLKEDILQKEKQNQELEDEIQRLRYNLMDKVGDNDVVHSLQREVQIKEDQMRDRDEEIKGLIGEKTGIEQEKIALRKEIEQLKIKQLLQKNVALQMKSNGKILASQKLLSEHSGDESSRREQEREIHHLQKQNEMLKQQVVALQQLQQKTVYGHSFLESKADMQSTVKDALTVGAAASSKQGSTVEVQDHAELKRDALAYHSVEDVSLIKDNSIAGPTSQEVEVKVEDAADKADRSVTADAAVAPMMNRMSEGAPEVQEIADPQLSATQVAEDQDPEIREVVENGTNMSIQPREVVESGNNMSVNQVEAAIEMHRISETMLQQTREELAMKEDKIKKMAEQMAQLEQNINDTAAEHAEKARNQEDSHSEQEKEWEKNRNQMQEHVQELSEAIREKVQAVEDLETQKQAIQEAYEMRLADKETEVEQAQKEHDQIQLALKKDVDDLKKVVLEQNSAHDEKRKEFEVQMSQHEEELKKESELKLQAKEQEIQQLNDELNFNNKELQDKIAEINDLQVELANQKEEEEKLVKKIEALMLEVGNVQELTEKVKEVTAEKQELQKENAAQRTALDGVSEKFKEELGKRKALLNELEDMKGKIRVYCRIRPFSKTEAEDAAKAKMCVEINDEMSLTVRARIDHHYNFDSVFGPESTQDQIFKETNRLVQSAIDGYNVCIFAYGQTGSGKTFTIQGTEQQPGLTPRSINELYGLISGMDERQFDVKLSCYMVEIYKGEMRDLLLPKNAKDRPKLEIRMNQQGQVQVKNVQVRELENMEDTNQVFEAGLGGRQVRKTLMNDESSRSHLIFSVIIDVTNKLNGKKTSGKLSFIDLAGSESSKKTGTDKEGQAEANAINQSLSALGNVISALAEGAKFIRYKENLLTKLMQDSLGGNAKTLMFVNCSPSVYNEMETKNSLEYAKRVKEIKNNPTLNLETKAMQRAQHHIEGQQVMIDSLKALAQDSGLGAQLAALMEQLEKKDGEGEREGGEEQVFSKATRSPGKLQEREANEGQIRDKHVKMPALKFEGGQESNEDKPDSGRSNKSGQYSARSARHSITSSQKSTGSMKFKK